MSLKFFFLERVYDPYLWLVDMVNVHHFDDSFGP